jgi:hypothetical protein
MDEEEARVVVHTWRAPRVSYPMTFYLFGLLMGIVALSVSPSILRSHQADHVSGGITFIVVGLGFVLQTLLFLIFPARRVEQLGNGHYRFVSLRRSLEVSPGELRWVRCIWLDPTRLLPMWLRTTTGGMLITPRMRGVEDLYSGLARANPDASIMSPTPNYFWPFPGQKG